MNKITLSIVLFGIFFLSIFFSGCDLWKKSSENPICFDTLQIDKTYHINDKPELPACNVNINFIYPKSSGLNNVDVVQSFFIEKVLGPTFKNDDSKSAAEKYVNHYIDNFKLFIENKSNDDSENENIGEKESESEFSYFVQLRDSISYNENGFISFTVETVSCEGGAHSSRNIDGYAYSLVTNERLTENDFAGDNYSKGLSNLIAEKIAESYDVKEVKELENLGFYSIKDIIPNDNFTLNKNGITYYFNKNEIAGSMVGIIEVFISYRELSFFLMEDSPISPLIPF